MGRTIVPPFISTTNFPHLMPAHPVPQSYTCKLFEEGPNKIAQKVCEETTELIVEAVSGNIDRIKKETADLLYHLLVLLSEKNIPLNDIMIVLSNRHKK